MSTFTFSAIPLGLGLSAAAHIHLCNRSLAQSEHERQKRITFSERCQIDIFLQSFSEKALFSELICLLEQTLYREDVNMPLSNCNNRLNRESIMKETGKVTQRRTWGTSYRSPLSNKGTVSTRMNLGTSLVDEESSEGNNRAHNEANNETNSQLRMSLINPSNNSQAEHPSEVTPSENLNITLEQVELWIKACKELRQSQEKVLQKTLVGSREDPSFWGLKANILVSLLLGTVSMMRLLPLTSFWTHLFTSHQPTCTHPFPTAPLIPTSPLLGSDWLLRFNSNNGEVTYPSLNSPAAFQFLPIAPTLFLSGIHFFVALRTRWTLSKIEQQTQTQRKIAKRTRMLCSTLLLREQRLTYLLRQIKVHESNTQSHPLSSPPMHGLSPHSLMTQGSMINSQVPRRNRVATCRNNSITQLFRSGPCEVDDAILAFAPDLELLNMERFLQDPAERSEVFRTELEALRQVLIVFQAEL